MKSRIHLHQLPSCARVLVLSLSLVAGCSVPLPLDSEPEVEMLARTEFTDRIENFFEYASLRSGETSEFLIHLTDLSEGVPIAQARVGLSVRLSGTSTEVAQTTALVGRVTGIYVAQLVAPSPGTYDIEFQVQSEQVDDTVLVTGFQVE